MLECIEKLFNGGFNFIIDYDEMLSFFGQLFWSETCSVRGIRWILHNEASFLVFSKKFVPRSCWILQRRRLLLKSAPSFVDKSNAHYFAFIVFVKRSSFFARRSYRYMYIIGSPPPLIYLSSKSPRIPFVFIRLRSTRDHLLQSQSNRKYYSCSCSPSWPSLFVFFCIHRRQYQIPS